MLENGGVEVIGSELTLRGGLIRLPSNDAQLRGRKIVDEALNPRGQNRRFVIALNLASTTPDWLRGIGGKPMAKGLDLSGGVHFVLQVDMDRHQGTLRIACTAERRVGVRIACRAIRPVTFNVARKVSVEIGQSRHQCHVAEVDDLRVSRHAPTNPDNPLALYYDNRVRHDPPRGHIEHPVGTHDHRLGTRRNRKYAKRESREDGDACSLSNH